MAGIVLLFPPNFVLNVNGRKRTQQILFSDDDFEFWLIDADQTDLIIIFKTNFIAI